MEHLPGMARPELQALPQIKDRMTFLYLERMVQDICTLLLGETESELEDVVYLWNDKGALLQSGRSYGVRTEEHEW